MNNDTLNLIERPYLEIVDDILTAMVGGVVNEPLIFDVKIDLYHLAEPAREVRGITGTVRKNGDQVHYVFQKEIDYAFDGVENAVVWQPKGTWPEDESVFYVDYFRRESRSPLTDINVGSVTRTLGEAIGREIATVYQQINLAYLGGFVDTAKGKALDLVVAILGVQRMTKDCAVGQATFFRNPAVPGAISIPEGTVLTTSKGDAAFQTTQPRTLQQGQLRIDAPIRAAEKFTGEAGRVDAGAITQMAQPIAGIERVTNFDATFLGADDESDDELRLRAKAALRGLGKGTLAALSRAIAETRATLVESWDPNGPDGAAERGRVRLMVATEPERFPSVRTAVEQTRAAGVQTMLMARYIYLKPRLVIELKPGLTAAGKQKAVQQLIEILQAYVDGLSSGQPAEGKELLKKAGQAPDVKKAKFVDVITWRTDLERPAAETLVDAVISAIQGVPTNDEQALRAALQPVLGGPQTQLAPTGQRLLDRSLVKGPSDTPATDEELEKGAFKVVAKVDGVDWWLVLDMTPTDVLLKEGGT